MKDSEDLLEDEEDFGKELLDIIKVEENIRYAESINTCLEIAHNQSVIYVIKQDM